MRLFVVAVTSLSALVLSLSAAFAHAEPSKVTPGQDAVLAASPAAIVIVMSQEMARQEGANDIVVQDSTGAEVTKQPASIDASDRTKLSVPLPANLPAGTYTVRWRTLSADDGDTASGNYSFKVDPNAAPSPGKENLREDPLGLQTPAGGEAPAAVSSGDPSGTSWVLIGAVAVGMFVLGAGSSFLLVQKKE